ncbi:MAG: hypothetical protein E7604_06930 [Ruminococcaceae bacterium]|nr:hypothetical protein [Oscillospiraceae bacterium]
MNMFEEQLWNYYQMIRPQKQSEEKMHLLDVLLEKEDAMRETFTPKQTSLFFQYNDSVGQYHLQNEQEVFIHGVQITLALLQNILKMIHNNPFNG